MLPVARPLPGPQPTTPGRLFLVLTATLTAGQAPLPPSWKRARVGGARVTGRGLALGRGLGGSGRRLRSRRAGLDPSGSRRGTRPTGPTRGRAPSPTALACKGSSSNRDFLPSSRPVEQLPARPNTLPSLRARSGALLCVCGAPCPLVPLSVKIVSCLGYRVADYSAHCCVHTVSRKPRNRNSC